MLNLGKIQTTPLSPFAAFISNSHPLDFRIVDFWAWSLSDLIENRNRGILAEFLVMKALGIQRPTRLEWNEVDLITDQKTLSLSSLTRLGIEKVECKALNAEVDVL